MSTVPSARRIQWLPRSLEANLMARLLVLTPQLPFPPHQGTTIRNFNLIAGLAQRHDVDLLSLTQPGDPPPAQTPLTTLCRQILALPAPPSRPAWRRLLTTVSSPLPDMALRLAGVAAFQQALLNLVQTTPYAVLQVEGIEMAPYARWLQQQPAWAAARRDGQPRLVFDDHNAEFLLQQRTALADLRRPPRWAGAAYSLVQWRKLAAYEAAVCRQADRVVAVSQADAEALRRLLPAIHVTVVPNGVDLKTFAPGCSAPAPEMRSDAVVFSGKMDYRPNVDAALWFADEILPRVSAHRPTVHFWIVGQQPHPRLARLAGRPNITVTGRVPDVRPYLVGAAVCVLPFRMGGGTRLKVLEALALGKAVASTTLGAEGFGLRDGQELRLADTAPAFAQVVLELLTDAAQRARLGAHGHAFAAAHYGWESIVPQLEAVYPP